MIIAKRFKQLKHHLLKQTGRQGGFGDLPTHQNRFHRLSPKDVSSPECREMKEQVRKQIHPRQERHRSTVYRVSQYISQAWEFAGADSAA